MEAEAKFDFVAESASELPLKKGVLVNILDVSDPNWYKAEINGTKGYVPSNYIELRPHEYVHNAVYESHWMRGANASILRQVVLRQDFASKRGAAVDAAGTAWHVPGARQ